MKLSEIPKIIHTIPYYKKEQLGWYFFTRIRKILPIRLWFNKANIPLMKMDKERLKRYQQYAKLWAEVEENIHPILDKILKGAVMYAGETIPLECLLQKQNISISPLAMYGIHSFEFLWHLCLAYLQSPNNKYAEFAKLWIKDWIKSNPIGKTVGWDPYPTSYRIRYWCLAIYLWKWNDKEILDSLAIQTKWLSKSIEYHLKANHVIQNLAGIIISSATFFPELLPKFLNELEKEVKEQILEDGGHYERCPMYHLHVLIDLLMVMAVLNNPPEYLKGAVSKMTCFLQNMTLSDGEIPLFGDSTFGHFPQPKKILTVALKYNAPSISPELQNARTSFPLTGYYLIKPNHSKPMVELVIRAGAFGPDYQLAHAHCDQLSYELLIQGQRVIVDSGIHGYAKSPYREFQRSTRAHNTVYVTGEEQLEYWGTFRVARRGKSEVLYWEEYNGEPLFVGRFKYYTGTSHTRLLYMLRGQGMLCWDWIHTKNNRTVESLIHLHPNLIPEFTNSFLLINHDKINLCIHPIGQETIEILSGIRDPMQGWYSEQFGNAVPNSVLVLKKKVKDKNISMGYWISFNADKTNIPKGAIKQWVEDIGKKINI